jgi:poly(hydroxyalkanoate) depolymerase family esterase
MLNNGNFAPRATAWVAAIGAIGLLLTPRVAASAALPVVTDTTEKCGTSTFLKQVTGLGSNPTSLGMYLYVPASLPSNPAVLVASHGCDGDGKQFCAATEFAKLADQYGFIVIYPTANTGTGGAHCFEVSGDALARSTGSDPAGVVSMVDYVLTTYSADSSRVFATGWSSGAMLTNVLLADYPDKFAAGAPFAGVPVSCMNPYPDGVRGNACSAGQVTKTAQEWGDAVRAAYDISTPLTRARPRVQLWHGTSDSILNYENFGEELKQWSNVLNVSTTPVSLGYLSFPTYPATRTGYGPSGSQILVETISVSGADHSLLSTPGLAAVAIHFFGLDDNADTTPPTIPANVQASNVTATGLTLTWSASSDDTGVTSYVVLQKLDSGSATVVPAKAVSGTTASISGLSASTAYQFYVQAQDQAGNASQASTILRVTTAAASGGGGGGNTGGGGGGSTGGGGGGGTSGGGSSGGCTHGDASSGLALLALGVLALVRGRRGSRRRSPISA